MSEERISWVFDLIDRVSGPSKAMARALRGVETAAAKAFDRLDARSKVGIVGALAKMGELQEKAGAGLKKVGAGLSWMGGAALEAGANIAAIGVAGAIGLGAIGAKFTVESLAFKENTLAAFKVMLGSKEAAADVYAKAVKFASVTPFSTKDVVENTQRLLAAGFKQSEVFDVQKVIGDIGIRGGPQAIESVIRAISQINAKGKFQGEELMQLSEAGVSSRLVFDALGKSLGKTTDEVQKLMSAGKISASSGITATLSAITNGISGGKAGSLSDELQNSLTGLGSTAMSRPFDLVNAANLDGLTEKMKGVLRGLGDALDPEKATGQRMVALIERIGNAFAKLLPEPESVVVAIGQMLDVLEPVTVAAVKFADGLIAGARPVVPVLRGIADAFAKIGGDGSLDRVGRGFETLGTVAGFLGASFVALTGVFVGLGVGLIDLVERVVEFPRTALTELTLTVGRFRAIGGEIVDGLWQGIVGAWDGLEERVTTLVNRLPDAARTALGIHSPSRVFAEIGMYSAQGFAGGFENYDIGGSITAAVQPPRLGGHGLGASGITVQLSVNVTPQAEGEGGREYGQRIGEGIIEQLTGFFETTASEGGFG